ncbi:hypothetical protein, partial [Pantoea sp. GbtcB22]|uniref:hypothetical protein n=1 Tax=Pantoea sp. GbtcB22 TaxID=2824767 RepID=UPI001C2F37C2
EVIPQQPGSIGVVVQRGVVGDKTGEATPLPVVLASPLYRGATIALFLAGLGQSAAAPQFALFLTKELGGSQTSAGLFFLT